MFSRDWKTACDNKREHADARLFSRQGFYGLVNYFIQILQLKDESTTKERLLLSEYFFGDTL